MPDSHRYYCPPSPSPPDEKDGAAYFIIQYPFRSQKMIVAATDMKLTCVFSVINPTNGVIVEKQPFTIDIGNLDVELFKNAHEQLSKLHADMTESVKARAKVISAAKGAQG